MPVRYNNKQYSKNIGQYPGYYEYKTIKINGIDVIPMTAELNIFEDLLSPTITGNITLIDTRNLIKNIPIIGEEEIEIELFDEYETIKAKYMIYKIAERQQINFGVLKYTLHFCSREMYVNSFKKLSKAYNQMNYELAIQDIKTTWLESQKPLLFSTTKYPQCFIIPNWNPLQACSWIASRAQDPVYVGGNFLFFENKEGFNFLAAENLLDETMNRPFATLSYDPLRKSKEYKAAYDARQEEHVMRFEDMNVVKSMDVIENMAFGMYKNKIRLVDVTKKTPEDFDYDYLTQFSQSRHLKGKLGQSHPISSGRNLATQYTLPMDNRVFIRHKGLFTNEVDGGNQVHEWYSPRLSQMFQMNNFVIEGTLPGQLEMKVGMIVTFDMPNIEDIDIGRTIEPDVAYSGNYLITSLRRTFQKDKSWIFVEMIKDSMSLDRNNVKVPNISASVSVTPTSTGTFTLNGTFSL